MTIYKLSELGLNDSDIGIIMNIHGSTVGRVLADGILPIINISQMVSKKKTVVAKTKKVAAPKKAAKKSVKTTKKVVAKTAKRA